MIVGNIAGKAVAQVSFRFVNAPVSIVFAVELVMCVFLFALYLHIHLVALTRSPEISPKINPYTTRCPNIVKLSADMISDDKFMYF